MNDALLLSPAVFVRMEGKVDLANELVDMEIHLSPELGGNLALFSALANPAAGAVVYLTQRIFKTQLRNARFRSYRAYGSWEDFELVDFDPDQQGAESNQPEAVDSAEAPNPAEDQQSSSDNNEPSLSTPPEAELRVPEKAGSPTEQIEPDTPLLDNGAQ